MREDPAETKVPVDESRRTLMSGVGCLAGRTGGFLLSSDMSEINLCLDDEDRYERLARAALVRVQERALVT